MQTIDTPKSVGRNLVRSKPSLKMFFACEDKASFLSACSIRRQVRSLCGDEVEIHSVFWNFALLRNDALQEWAVAEAASADMIVVSLHDDFELPTHVKSWVEHLPARDKDAHGALVAVVGGTDAIQNGRNNDISYLRGIAESRGLDFLCNKLGGRKSGVRPRANDFTQADLRNN